MRGNAMYRRADHQGRQPIAEAADHRRHDHEEDHDQPVGSDEDVIGVRVLEDLQAGKHQLGAHHHRKKAAYEAGHDREHKIHRADVLVVRGIDITSPACGMIGVVAQAQIVCTCHGHSPLLLTGREARRRAHGGKFGFGVLYPLVEFGLAHHLDRNRHEGVAGTA